jgi:hypothetical protein
MNNVIAATLNKTSISSFCIQILTIKKLSTQNVHSSMEKNCMLGMPIVLNFIPKRTQIGLYSFIKLNKAKME